MLPSWVLPSACKGTGIKTPPPLRELPGITQRGRVCDEVMNRVVGIWGSQGWGHIRRLNPQTELGQGFIISLPFTASASTKQSLTWGLCKIRRHQGAIAPNRGCEILCNLNKWQKGRQPSYYFAYTAFPLIS